MQEPDRNGAQRKNGDPKLVLKQRFRSEVDLERTPGKKNGRNEEELNMGKALHPKRGR